MKTPTRPSHEPANASSAGALEQIGRQLRIQGVAFENSPDSIVVTDAAGAIVWVNPAFTAISGYAVDEVVGRNPRFLQSGRHDAAFYANLWRTIRYGGTWRGELTNRRKNGEIYFGEQTIVPVRAANGAISHFVAIMNDVTSRKAAESELRTTHAELRQLLEYSSAVTYRMELRDGVVTRLTVGENITLLLGFADRAASNYSWWCDQLHPADRARVTAGLSTMVAEEPLAVEYRMAHLDGGYRWIADNRRMLPGNAGQPAEIVGVWTDITERKRAADMLQGAPTTQASKLRKRIVMELVIIAVGAAFVFMGGHAFGWFELAFISLANEEIHPFADEAFGTAAFVLIGMAVFSYRRSRESRGEAMAQSHLAAAIRTLHAELDVRVQQRTAELAAANRTLHAEAAARRLADEALRESEERYRALVEHAPTGIFVNLDGRFVYANATMCRIFGATSEQVLASPMFDRLHPDCHVVIRERIARGLAGESAPLTDQRYVRFDGSVVDVETIATPITFQGQRAIQVVVNDISRRKRAEAALRDSEAQFRDLAENINEVFWLTSPGLDEILYVSPGYERIWGRTCASLRASPKTWLEAIHPDDRERVHAAVAQMAAGLFDEEYRIIRPDGSMRWVRDRAFPIQSPDGTLARLAGLAEDITDRKRAESRLRLQQVVTQMLAEATSAQEIYRQVLQTIGGALDWDVGELWTVDRVKGALVCADISHPATENFVAFARASRALSFKVGVGLQGRVWREDKAVWVSDIQQETGCPRRTIIEQLGLRSWIGFPIRRRKQVVGVVGFFSGRVLEADAGLAATLVAFGSQLGQFLEKQQLTDQFQQAQKMEALGTLAGGIAHDFNNIIAGVTGYTELAKMDVEPGTEIVDHLDAILRCSARAAGLVKQIMAFSRQEEHQRRPIQVRHIVSEALHLLRATIPTTIAFESDFARGLPTVLADANQVHQIMMNLGSNAWHAMRGRAGKLGVRLESCDVDALFAEIHPGLKPGSYVRLSVSDTGHGMDSTTLARIFDPFFTTKKPGEGTGLGLAVVHGIMQSHEGVVTVYSQPGEGTIFHLYFPACERTATEQVIEVGAIPRGCGEPVLYVDDEPLLAQMGQRLLAQLGYAADSQTDPVAALELMRRDSHRYSLVITDLTMPTLTGTEFAGELLKLRPDLPVILVTGYAATLTVEQVHALGIREFLLKPHSVRTLGQTVARVLTAVKST